MPQSNSHTNSSSLYKHIAKWITELDNDWDKPFIISGIQHGFSIIDKLTTDHVAMAESANHKSVTLPIIKDKVEQRIVEEIQEGNYAIVSNKPTIVSGLCAVPKPDGDVRVVHDLSQPPTKSLNDYASKDVCKYQTIQDALSIIKPNYFMAKVDLKWAYRSVCIRPEHTNLTGLKWTFTGMSQPTYLIDKRLPFGARKSPSIFNRLTQAVRRMMSRKGFNVITYLDDFLVIGTSFENCLIA